MAFAIDTSTPFGARAAERLANATLGWLVTVSPGGAPQPSRIWFVWDAGTILLYSQPDTPKLRNIAANPKVAVHLDGDDRGGDILIVAGTAAISADPPADRRPDYVAKYRTLMAKNGWSPADFAERYAVPVRVEPTRLRGW
jgi:PPOX class probable F420-dependent enzyme